MAIQEGPFQNIVSIDTDDKEYFSIFSETNTGPMMIGLLGLISGIKEMRLLSYQPYFDRSNVTFSDQGYVAVPASDINGFSIKVHDRNLDITQTYYQPGEPGIIGGCADNSFIFFARDGLGSSHIIKRGSLTAGILIESYEVSTYNVVIEDSNFSIPQGQDYDVITDIRYWDVAPLPDGGFCVAQPATIRDGFVATGEIIFQGHVVTYFSPLGTQGTQVVVANALRQNRGLEFNGGGAVRPFVYRSFTQLVMSESKSVANTEDTSLQRHRTNAGITGPVVDIVSQDDIVFLKSTSVQFIPSARYEVYFQDFTTGAIQKFPGLSERQLDSGPHYQFYKHRSQNDPVDWWVRAGLSLQRLNIRLFDKNEPSLRTYSFPGYHLSCAPIE